jgi:hypothetical protein
MEDYNFPHAGPIKQDLPSDICRINLEEQQDGRKKNIMQINQWDNEVVKEFITMLAECTKSISNLFSNYTKN